METASSGGASKTLPGILLEVVHCMSSKFRTEILLFLPHTHIHTHTYADTYTQGDIHIHTETYIHIHMETYIHTDRHIQRTDIHT